MKFSIITVCYNAASTISATLNSIIAQQHVELEVIVIDGASTDGTVDIVRGFGNSINHFISETDNGIYDAMNKGVRLATGDVIGFLNADDFYVSNSVLEKIQHGFKTNKTTVVAGAVEQINALGQTKRIICSESYVKNGFCWGMMLPHPATFVSKSLFDRVGIFATKYKIAGDFDFFVRLCCHPDFHLTTLEETIVKMRIGGVSTMGLRSYLLLSREFKQSLIENGFSNHHWRIDLRIFRKIKELRPWSALSGKAAGINNGG